MADSPILLVRNAARRFGGTVVLEDMNLVIERGSIHALVGESGAGKSTLIKMLAGIVAPTGGAIEFDGKPAKIDSPNAARKLGIGVVLQQPGLFPERPVLANLFVNREPLHNGLVSRREMEARSRALLRQLGLAINVHAPLGDLDPAERQFIALARALLENPRLLILDEPNSALDQRQSERLFAALRGLKARGMSMLYASNRLEDTLAIADQMTVVRNGRDVLSKARQDLTVSEEAMIGQLRQSLFPLPLRALPTLAATLRPQLTIAKLGGGTLNGISFMARAGEIVGLAGLAGSGAQELLAMLFGQRTARTGKARFPDGDGLPRTRTEAARRNICMISGERGNGLMPDKSIAFNLSVVVAGARDWGTRWYSPKVALDRAARQIEALRIRSAPETPAASLSAGGQQKVVIAKWLEIGPQVVLLDEPARGIDIGSKQEIYALIRQMAASGCIVLLHSRELSELTGLSDRILVFHRGRIAGEVAGADADAAALQKLVAAGAPAAENRQTKQEGVA
ncbi:sugar ABC transporter ATP-binding protein [Mesorhizobium sp. M00.F.Ca.ET.186.01.1.1]|nr:sugar ABC transporter ATP-binding protein [bacterium M00.F.Ca.ET.205.01.1.1]TGU52499.1 sugar ABC transporter ATP-binding protein [bacterium M00.F.Ca.ET.152.01.1.1]TGV34827.1 sugar ABC transporter ATP-binding protein [Mesorhizobium sp. M00.F.Ca.ET.186.01.1.1]TGZ42778.1 sugar ABC transporter ATP-binding protein [bacterium M00.F.Ca.ET.162.01.1.1]